jgi:hypothetical protein
MSKRASERNKKELEMNQIYYKVRTGLCLFEYL